MSYSPSSPSSPTSSSPPRRKNPVQIPGFRPSPRPNQRPIAEMTVRELQDRHNFNAKLLSSPQASTSTYAQRVLAEQAAVESRLVELSGMEAINTGLRRTAIRNEEDMPVEVPPEPHISRTIEAKRKALSQFGMGSTSSHGVGTMSMDEAIELERQAHLQDKARQERIAEKKKRLGMTTPGEVLTRQEREARIWAFMNHKPTDSDLEDDDEDDDDDDDPANWFEDDQDDGRKGQDIIYPDEDLSDIIRVDDNRIRYSSFYDPRDDGD
ncbi:hypothetical protein D9613_005359 [Agrocybe pediades]|uniref:Uncharacterized protein n=1 Tax=Agrocybe pediades TaxID=84607 RepID=A0A8H4R040_9AGAR|nr:hypothetical protein D9613_005359 [Agrocybe pediades]KAF9569351.1 hypothetical protein CPC08DRAFT_653316 [Agrocybe pediades]